MDKKAKIDMCLTCKRQNCTGNCARVQNAAKQKKKPREYNAKKYEYQGEWLPLKDVAARCGIDYTTLYLRIEVKHWSMKRATTEPVHSKEGRIIEAFGEGHTLREWARITGLPLHALKHRFSSGWEPERALTQPLMKPRGITVDGEQITAVALARQLNIDEALVHYRVRRGWTGDMIVEHYGGQA